MSGLYRFARFILTAAGLAHARVEPGQQMAALHFYRTRRAILRHRGPAGVAAITPTVRRTR